MVRVAVIKREKSQLNFGFVHEPFKLNYLKRPREHQPSCSERLFNFYLVTNPPLPSVLPSLCSMINGSKWNIVVRSHLQLAQMGSFQPGQSWRAHVGIRKHAGWRLPGESEHLHYEKPQSRSTSEIQQVCPREGSQMWHNTEVPCRPELSCLSVIHVISAVGCSHGSVATDFSCDSRLSSAERCQFCRLPQH